MKRPNSRLILPLLIAAFIFRVYHLAAQPLSGDEAFTVTQWGTATLSTLFTTIAQIDPQPPVALLSYYSWIQLAGSSEFAVRLLSALFSLIAVAGAYTLSCRFLQQRGALLVVLLCATDPFQLWYAQDARPYAQWIALSLLASIAFLKAMRARRIRPWLAYIIFGALGLQVFYLEVFSLAATNLYALYHSFRARRVNPAWPISQLILVITFVPWLLYSKPQNSTYQPTASFPNIPAGLTELLFSNTLPGALNNPILSAGTLTAIQLLVVIAIAAAIFLLARSRHSQDKYLLILQALLPLILLTALSLLTHKAFFRARYVAIVSIPLLVLLTYASLSFQNKRTARATSFVFVALFLGINLATYTEYQFNPQYAKAPPWRDIAATLKRDALPRDLVIQNYPDPALGYYYSGPAPTTILPSGENPPPETTITKLAPLPAAYRHIWFIRVDTPFWDKQEVVANWLAANTLYLTDMWVGNLRLYQYASPQANTTDIGHRLDYDMGLATLLGYTAQPDMLTASSSHTITLELFWQPKRQTKVDLRVFAHLLSTRPDGTVTLWSQDDHPPQQGRLSTTSWPTDGTIFRDVYHIPLSPTIPPGTYILAAGFYQPPSTRYPLSPTLRQPEPNAVQITIITLSAHP